MSKKLTLNEFIAKAREVHGDKYDYSKVEYKDIYSKVTIICPIHGEFEQVARNHLKGRGCKICGKETYIKKQSLTTERFISNVIERYGDKYDLSHVDYVNSKTKNKSNLPRKRQSWTGTWRILDKTFQFVYRLWMP